MFTKIEFVVDTKRISCLQVKKDEEQCWLGYCIEIKSWKKLGGYYFRLLLSFAFDWMYGNHMGVRGDGGDVPAGGMTAAS